MNPKRSIYDLGRAVHYLRLAYQSMSKDQEEATKEIGVVRDVADRDTVDLLLGFAGLCAGKAVSLKEERDAG